MKHYSTKQLEGLTGKDLMNFVLKHYKTKIQGKSVVNKDKGLTVEFTAHGRNKTARSTFNKKRALVVMDLIYVVKEAIYSNFSKPKTTHVTNYDAVGILNFKYKCLIDSKPVSVRISIIQTKGLKFQYALTFDKNI